MNSEKQLKKQEAKRIREINSSLTYLSEKVQREIGVLAIHKEDNVYYCGNNTYKKAYVFKPSVLGNKKKELIKALCRSFHNRIRMSLCIKNKDGKLNTFMFMTVSYEAASYYEALSTINSFETRIIQDICNILNITIKTSSFEDNLAYMHMCCTGEMVKIDSDALFSRKFSGTVFEKLKNPEAGRFEMGKRHGAIFLGKNYIQNSEELKSIFFSCEGTYHVCVDFQSYGEEDKNIYQLEMRNRYNHSYENDGSEIVNMTYILTVFHEDADRLTEICENIMNFYDEKGIQLMPGAGRENEIFMSYCTLGLLDFHSMQNVNAELVSELLM